VEGFSPTVELRSREDDGEGALRAKRGSVGGVGGFTEGGVGFYRAEARPSAFNDRHSRSFNMSYPGSRKHRTKATIRVPRMFNHTHGNNMINR
jgi:hypothetical protein